MEQQEQTRQYFRSVADVWQNKSADLSGEYNMIQDRSRAVLEVIDSAKNVLRFLDVGCGSGQLVIDVAKRGIEAEGNDFADEMILKCEENRKLADVSAKFISGSFFDVNFDDNSYDFVSAQGFIEYLSPDKMTIFFKCCYDILRPGGSLVVGSRNRLFNAFSLNDFTTLEASLGTMNILLSEAMALQTSGSQEAALEALRQYERIDPQPKTHPSTGIPVDARHQYAPSDLIYRLRQFGFSPKTIFPVHYHGIPLSLKLDYPELHSHIAKIMSDIGIKDQRLVPFSSTYVLQVLKPT